MTTLLRTAFLSMSTLAISSQVWAAPVVANGSFEADPVIIFLSVAGGGLTGWTVGPSPGSGSGYPFLINNAYGASTPYGSQFITLGLYTSNGTGYIEQSIAGFSAGSTYSLSFALASEQAPGQSQLQVSFQSGSTTGPAIFTAPATSSNYWRNWNLLSQNFLATASSVTIRFTQVAGTGGDAGSGGGGYDVGLDNVSVSLAGSAVPEPGTMLLLAGGLLTIGAHRWNLRRGR